MTNLENRANSIEQSIILLTSKMNNFQINFLNRKNSTEALPEVSKIFLCHLCEYETSDKSTLKEHKEKHTSGTSYNCNSCDYTTSQKSNHTKHQELHEDLWRNLRCQKCSYVAIHQRDLNRHEKGMHEDEDEQVFVCNRCEHTTQYEERLEEHIKEEHSQQTRSRYFYATSRYTHKNKNSERIPENQSFSDKPINCNSCEYKTHLIEELRGHKKLGKLSKTS